MRFNEFNPLNEDDDKSVPQMKKEIVSRVKDTDDFNVLDRIYQVLSHSTNKTKIRNAFGDNVHGSRTGSEEQVINDMMHQLSTIAGTTKQKEDFIEALEQGKAVNTKALLSKTSSFSEIFVSEFAENFFMSIANYGRGTKMKGPGEFALAIMSPEIKLASKGDLEINGRHVEVKSALSKSGGRLGEVGANKEAIMPVLTKVALKYVKTPDQEEKLDAFLSRNSIGIVPAVKALHDIFDGNKTAIKSVVSAVTALTFDESIGNAIGEAAAKDASGIMAEQAYMKENFNWYKNRDGFDELLAIWFGGKKTFSFSTGEELIHLRSSGAFGSAGISFVPTKPNEVYAQINFTSGNVDLDTIMAKGGEEGDVDLGAPKKAKSPEPTKKMSAAAGGAKAKTAPKGGGGALGRTKR